MGEIRIIPPPLTRDEWNALLDHGLEREVAIIIRKGSTSVQAIVGSGSLAGSIYYSVVISTTQLAALISVLQYCINNIGNGRIVVKGETFSDNIDGIGSGLGDVISGAFTLSTSHIQVSFLSAYCAIIGTHLDLHFNYGDNTTLDAFGPMVIIRGTASDYTVGEIYLRGNYLRLLPVQYIDAQAASGKTCYLRGA